MTKSKTNNKNTSKSSTSSQSKKKGSKNSKLSVKRQHPLHNHFTKVACSITDPFCPAARNAHHPDGRGAGTVAFQVRGQATLQTDAAGAALYLFVPGLGRYGWQGSVIAASNCTVGSTWFTNAGSAFINTNADEVRIVSWGVNFKSVLSATNCQGLVHTFTTNNAAVNMVIPQMSNNNLEDTSTTLTAGFSTTFISKPVGSAAESFRKYSEATTTMSAFDWTSFGLEVLGGPASVTFGYAEIVVNVEFTLNNTGVSTTGLGGVVSTIQPPNPLAIAASRHVQGTTSSLINGTTQYVENLIKNKASSFMSDALSDLGSFGMTALALI